MWILGAPDPEMELIESILRARGERVEYATVWRDGVRRRVTPAEAYAPDVEIGEGLRGLRATAYMVECAPAVLVGSSVDGIDWAGAAVTIDHHRPGDPGYGRPPAEFLPASSIGQVISLLFGADRDSMQQPSDWIEIHGYAGYKDDYALDETLSMCLVTAGGYEPLPLDSNDVEAVERSEQEWFALIPGYGWGIKTYTAGCEDGSGSWTYRIIPAEYVLAAAADHCLAAAYRGECPGVDPDALMRWRAESRAKHQGRTVDEVLADVERARELLEDAPNERLAHGVYVADMRGYGHVPELPEAALREGVCFIASLTERDGRIKVVCQSGTPEQIEAFIERWAPAQGLTDIYGDPARGFAGGYLIDELVGRWQTDR